MMYRNSSFDHRLREGRNALVNSRRTGATVLEVLFAIFVVIVGLMGIASILPLAARNAEQSNAYNQALAQGKIWLNDFFARGLNDHDAFTTTGLGFNWQWRNDDSSVTPANSLQTYFKAGPGSPATPTNSAVTSGAGMRIWGHQSVCIDPVFMTDPDVIRGFNSGTAPVARARYASYRASVFPYYEDGHNPIEDPMASPTNAWHDQPRMLRVTLGGSGGQMPNQLAKDLFASLDDVATFINEKDKTVPASRVFSGGGLKSATTGDYSWMATLSPEPVAAPVLGQTTSDYVLSLVIMQRRDKQFLTPGNAPPAGSIENKPQGERLVWVVPLSGNFQSGTGGRVRLISNRSVESRLHVGDWLMLGKHYYINDANASVPALRYGYFRWYRIIAVDAEPRIDELRVLSPSGTDPYGNQANTLVWSRDVVLEGPDWAFVPTSFTTPLRPFGQSKTYQTPTSGTLMSNVVTVIERNVTVD